MGIRGINVDLYYIPTLTFLEVVCISKVHKLIVLLVMFLITTFPLYEQKIAEFGAVYPSDQLVSELIINVDDPIDGEH